MLEELRSLYEGNLRAELSSQRLVVVTDAVGDDGDREFLLGMTDEPPRDDGGEGHEPVVAGEDEGGFHQAPTSPSDSAGKPAAADISMADRVAAKSLASCARLPRLPEALRYTSDL